MATISSALKLVWCEVMFQFDLQNYFCGSSTIYKYYGPQVRPKSKHSDHDSTFHVSATPALTTRPSLTLNKNVQSHHLRVLR